MANIAVIVLDTLRHDTFSKYFDWIDGYKFNNAWSTSHWTGPAHASLLTGRYPTEINTTSKSRSLTCDTPLITEALQNAGYTTRMISTNLQIFVWNGWNRGFNDRFGPRSVDVDPVPTGCVDWQSFNEETTTTGFTKYLRGAVQCLDPRYRTIQSFREGYRMAMKQKSSYQAVVNRISTINTNDDDFLFANIMDMHAPYHPPKPYRSVDQKIKPEVKDVLGGDINNSDEIRQAYTDCARYLSDAYQSLHADLLDKYDYVITLSDHGEHLGEGGLWLHTYGLRPELTHIALIISGKDISDEVVNIPVSLVDVHQTIADLANISVESHGQSLLDSPEPADRLVEYHGFSDNLCETLVERGLGSEVSWRDKPLDAIVATEGYAFETHQNGLQTSGRWSADEAQERLNALTESINRQPIRSETSAVSGSLQQQLEALGYA